MRALLFLLAWLFSISNVFSQTIHWSGANGDWSDPSNWNTGVLPAPGDNVIIDDFEVNVDINATVKSIKSNFFAEAKLVIDAGVHLTVTGSNGYGISSMELIENNGTMTVSNTDDEGIYSTPLDNNGTANFGPAIGEAAYRAIGVGDPLTNNGTINVDGAYHGLRSVNALMTNNGTMNITNCTIHGIYLESVLPFTNNMGKNINISNCATGINVFKSNMVNNGNVDIQNCSNTGINIQDDFNSGVGLQNNIDGIITILQTPTAFDVGGSEFLNNDGAISCGAGTVDIKKNGGTFTNAGLLQGIGNINLMPTSTGTIIPGLSPGTMSIIGVALPTTLSNGTLDMEIQDNSGAGTGNDLIEHFNTVVTLDGSIIVSLIGGFTPSIGDCFTLIECEDGCMGTFSSVSLPTLPATQEWEENYNPFDYTICVVAPIVPIELISFEAFKQDELNQIVWETSSEINVAYHIVEKSSDARNWSELGRLKIDQNSHVINSYRMEDHFPDRITYYRLRVSDHDGSQQIFPVSVVQREELRSLKIYPNPSKGMINLASEIGAELKIYNSQGVLVVDQELIEQTVQIDLSSGLYICQVKVSGKIETQKITVLEN